MQLPLLTVAAAARPFPAPPQRKPLPAAGDADARGTPAAGGEAATHSTKAREQRQRMPPAAPARSSSSATSRPRGSSTIPAGRPTPRHPPAAAAAFRRNCRQRWARPEPARLRPRGRPEPRRAEPSRAGREGGRGRGWQGLRSRNGGSAFSTPLCLSACQAARLRSGWAFESCRWGRLCKRSRSYGSAGASSASRRGRVAPRWCSERGEKRGGPGHRDKNLQRKTLRRRSEWETGAESPSTAFGAVAGAEVTGELDVRRERGAGRAQPKHSLASGGGWAGGRRAGPALGSSSERYGRARRAAVFRSQTSSAWGALLRARDRV